VSLSSEAVAVIGSSSSSVNLLFLLAKLTALDRGGSTFHPRAAFLTHRSGKVLWERLHMLALVRSKAQVGEHGRV
jgi:hypothetical protein